MYNTQVFPPLQNHKERRNYIPDSATYLTCWQSPTRTFFIQLVEVIEQEERYIQAVRYAIWPGKLGTSRKQQGAEEYFEMLELLQMNWLIIDQNNANNKMHRSSTPLQTNTYAARSRTTQHATEYFQSKLAS